MLARLAFFVSVAAHVKKFLTMFQGERPLLPFVADELHSILKALMVRFVKKDVLDKADTVLKLCKIQCNDAKNHMEYKRIDIGFAANAILRAAPQSISDLQKMAFRKGCCTFLAAMTAKLFERNPLNYSLVRNMYCFRPRSIVSCSEKCSDAFKKVLEVMLAKMHLSAPHCDKASQQYRQMCEDIKKSSCKDDFLSFKESSSGSNASGSAAAADRLDDFLYAKLGQNQQEYPELWSVVKLCLILSHGQASVESGFSINKEMLVENQLSETLVCQRRVYDGICRAGLLLFYKYYNNIYINIAI